MHHVFVISIGNSVQHGLGPCLSLDNPDYHSTWLAMSWRQQVPRVPGVGKKTSTMKGYKLFGSVAVAPLAMQKRRNIKSVKHHEQTIKCLGSLQLIEGIRRCGNVGKIYRTTHAQYGGRLKREKIREGQFTC